MKERVEGATQDGEREGVNTEGGWMEFRAKWKRKGDGHSVGNKVFKEEEEDREDTQSVSWSLADCHDIWSIPAVGSS